MRVRSAPSIEVVKREEKEGRLQAFAAGSVIEIAGADGSAISVLSGSLLARSASSPVVRALRALRTRQPTLTCAFRVVLTTLDADGDALAALSSLATDVRLVEDRRLLDAHEQLVLGPRTSWTGDSMRRDPEKRDAYERFADDCADGAEWAAVAFERIWKSGRPVKPEQMLRAVGEPMVPESAPPHEVATGEAGDRPAASTRH